MSKEHLIRVEHICLHYQVEASFFTNLHEFGLVEVAIVEDAICIHEDDIQMVEKIIRLRQELNINLEGIEAVFNLQEKIEYLQSELIATKNRLKLYEG